MLAVDKEKATTRNNELKRKIAMLKSRKKLQEGIDVLKSKALIEKARQQLIEIRRVQITKSSLLGSHLALEHLKTEMMHKELNHEILKQELLKKLVSVDKHDQLAWLLSLLNFRCVKIRSAAFVFFTLKNMHKYKNQIFLNTTFNLVKR